MKKALYSFCGVLFIIFFLLILIASAQSGGTYELTQTVSITGGTSSGGTFSLENTSGQPVAGNLPQAENYSLYTGFWTPPNPLPTAASVRISGRILTSKGQGIRNVFVILTDSSGSNLTTTSSGFGYYSFTNIKVGEPYIISIRSRRFTFSNPIRFLNVSEQLSNIDFIADNQ